MCKITHFCGGGIARLEKKELSEKFVDRLQEVVQFEGFLHADDVACCELFFG